MTRIEPGLHTPMFSLSGPAVVKQQPKTAASQSGIDAGGDAVDLSAAARQNGAARLQRLNDELNRLAESIRNKDEYLQQAGKLLGDMKTDLVRIIKNYPPYPPGDADRVRFLNGFNGLRRQIEQLTIPPDYDMVGEILGAAGGSAVANLPELPTQASDEQVRQADAAVDRAQAETAAQRQALRDVQARAAERVEADVAAALASNDGETPALPGTTEQDAAAASAGVRRELAQSEAGITAGGPQLAALAG